MGTALLLTAVIPFATIVAWIEFIRLGANHKEFMSSLGCPRCKSPKQVPVIERTKERQTYWGRIRKDGFHDLRYSQHYGREQWKEDYFVCNRCKKKWRRVRNHDWENPNYSGAGILMLAVMGSVGSLFLLYLVTGYI